MSALEQRQGARLRRGLGATLDGELAKNVFEVGFDRADRDD